MTTPDFQVGLLVQTTSKNPKLPMIPRVVEAATILQWTVGQPWRWVKAYCEDKHWHIQMRAKWIGQLGWSYNLETLEPVAKAISDA